MNVPPPQRSIYRGPGDGPRRSASPTSATDRRGCRLSSFFLAVLVIALSCVCLILTSGFLSQVVAPRTNVLILGLDRRPEQAYTVRSDVLMLATADPRAPRVALLSIPRDLYVEIPGHGQNRINTAHFWGELEAEGSGAGLAMRTVSEVFGVPVRHYVRVDFNGFRAVVDAAGGVDILVEDRIVDDAYPTEDYGTRRIEIPAGPQHMNGERALQYVRSRHGASDFERSERQQEVMATLARKLSAPMNWPRLPAVVLALVEHVETNLGPVEILQLSAIALRVGPEGVEHHAIDRDMVRPWTTPSGGAVLLPRWDAINPLVDRIFSP